MDGATEDFNPLLFEKKLTSLKDTQDSIQHLSTWCLKQRQHHKKIVASWLNVLKRVKVEQRLTLFYLANDVIQYSKRKSYEFVESWGTTLQKATPLVRDDKVKHRILRIFKIWEQRAVYDEEFLTDLTGLLSAGAGKRAPDDDPNDFQPSFLVNKIKQCSVLEADTDLRLKHIHDCHLSMSDADALCTNLKVLSDKRNTEEVQKELDDAIGRMERYSAALQREIVARETLCALLVTANNYYDTQRGEVKVVANAYKNFGARVRGLKRKLDELIESLPRKPVSPVPSPPIASPPVTPPRAEDVPSPGPEEDLELPRDEEAYNLEKTFSTSILSDGSMFGSGFSSFLGSTNPFNFYQDSMEKIPKVTELITGDNSKGDGDNSQGSKTDFNINEFFKSMNSDPIPNNNNNENGNNYGGVPPPPPPISAYSPPPVPAPRQTNNNIPLLGSSDNDILPGLELLTPTSEIGGVPVPSFYSSQLHNTSIEQVDPYNSQHNSWNNNAWETPPALRVPPQMQQDIPSLCLDTPESPPPHDRKAEKNIQPIITIDSTTVKTSISDIDHRLHSEPPPLDMDHRLQPIVTQVTDIDHRGLLPPPPIPPSLFPLSGDMDHRSLPPTSGPPPSVNQNTHHSHRNQNQDIDHRNLISLTAPSHNQPPQSATPTQTIDQDYRIPPPPMPPLMSSTPMVHQMPLGNNPTDIMESVDMDLSEDEDMRSDMHFGMQHGPNFSLPPPPPFEQYGQHRNMPNLAEEEPVRPPNRQFMSNNKVLTDASVHSETPHPAADAYRESCAPEREPRRSPAPEKHEPLLPALDAPFDFQQLARPGAPGGAEAPARARGPPGPGRVGPDRPGEPSPAERGPRPPYSARGPGWRPVRPAGPPPPGDRFDGPRQRAPRPFGFAPFRYPPPRGARGQRRPMRPQRGFW